jgi:ABC-type polysaccharide/polyol phosphate transport system ATPase subunit
MGNYATIKAVLSGSAKSQSENPIEALRDVSFQVEAGEGFGLIGRNGAGKSTALKIAAGIFSPNEGSVAVNGRLGSLIELGLGFHPEFTGRENALVSGILHGLRRREVQRRLDDIFAFADLGDFLDEPVRTYSSGMYMRLGFSVAIHCDPEILLIDEIFAVGDKEFAQKCLEWIKGFRARGGTIILTSHNLNLVREHCQRAVWLEHGQIRARGEVGEVVDAYEASIAG